MKIQTSSQLAGALIQTAHAEIGTREVGGSNRGVRVDLYQEADTLTSPDHGYPWCASFVAWVIRQVSKASGIAIPWSFSASCDVLLVWARERGLLRAEPAPGFVMLVRARRGSGYSEGDMIHTGLVSRVEGNAFWSIEGNTNGGGGREGTSVLEHKRDKSARYYFIALPLAVKFADAVAEKPYSVTLRQNATSTTTLPVRMEGGNVLVPAREFAAALGKTIAWNAANGVVEIGGVEVEKQPRLFDGRAYFWVRDLAAQFAGKLSIDVKARVIEVTI